MSDKRISQLPPLTSALSINAKVAIAQNGVTYQATAGQVASLYGNGVFNGVLVDGTSITGDGKSTPLKAVIPELNVTVDNLTIAGNGNDEPLRVIAYPNLQVNNTLVGNGSATTPLGVANPLPAIGNDGQILGVVNGAATWIDKVDEYLNGVVWNPTTQELSFYMKGGGILPVNIGVGNEGWGTQVVESNESLIGNGTQTSPLGISTIGASPGEFLMFNGQGLSWGVPTGGEGNGTSDDWGNQVVQSDATLTGQGTQASTLKVANPLPVAGSDGQVLTVVGGNIQWANSNTGLTSVATNSTINGDGTSGNALGVANPLPVAGSDGQVLTVVGGNIQWSAAQNNYVTNITVTGTLEKTITLTRQGLPNLTATFNDATASGGGSDNWGSQVAATNTTIDGDGTSGSPLGVAIPLPSGTNTQTLYHNGTDWASTSLLKNSGSALAINASILPTAMLNIESSLRYAVLIYNSDSSQNSYGIKSLAASAGANDDIGGFFEASNTGAGNAYAVQLKDGTEAVGKYLKCITADGKAQWADAPSSGGLPVGTENQTLRYDSNNDLVASSLLQNDGVSIAIGVQPSSAYLLRLEGNPSSSLIHINKTGTISGTDYGIYSRMVGSGTGSAVSGRFEVSNTTGGATGVWVTAIGNTTGQVVAGQFLATNNGSGPAYAVRIEDGSQAIDKVLKSVDGNGNAQWASIVDVLYEDSIPVYTPNGTSQTIDLSTNLSHNLNLGSATGDVTLTLNNPKLGVSYVIEITQDNSSAKNVIFPSSVKWSEGTAPTISTGASAVDVIVLYWNGTDYKGFFNQNFS